MINYYSIVILSNAVVEKDLSNSVLYVIITLFVSAFGVVIPFITTKMKIKNDKETLINKNAYSLELDRKRFLIEILQNELNNAKEMVSECITLNNQIILYDNLGDDLDNNYLKFESNMGRLELVIKSFSTLKHFYKDFSKLSEDFTKYAGIDVTNKNDELGEKEHIEKTQLFLDVSEMLNNLYYLIMRQEIEIFDNPEEIFK